MKTREELFSELVTRYPVLENCKKEIEGSSRLLWETVQSGGKILLCGNGGSCADCEHISGELLKGFLSKRPLTAPDLQKFSRSEESMALGKKLQYGICAIPLPSMSALFTAFCNDVDPAVVYAQLVFACGKPGDALICISTSGNAENICNAARTARTMGMPVIGLTGRGGGKLAGLCDECIRVPEDETFKVQELHLPVYHCICAVLEAELMERHQ